MKQLWAPWRMTYIQGHDDNASSGCIFCVRDRHEEDTQRLILHRGEHACIMMNKYPYSNGHLMVAPYQHTSNLETLSDAEALEMHRLTLMARAVLKECFAPQGFNLGMNLGGVAGAGIEEHLHQHIVPRWQGDTNFMPVFADVRVIPQHLEDTFVLLKKAVQELSR